MKNTEIVFFIFLLCSWTRHSDLSLGGLFEQSVLSQPRCWGVSVPRLWISGRWQNSRMKDGWRVQYVHAAPMILYSPVLKDVSQILKLNSNKNENDTKNENTSVETCERGAKRSSCKSIHPFCCRFRFRLSFSVVVVVFVFVFVFVFRCVFFFVYRFRFRFRLSFRFRKRNTKHENEKRKNENENETKNDVSY